MKKPFLHGRTTVGERGQIVIPQNIRTALKLKPGAEMVVMTRGNKIVVIPADHLESFLETILSDVDHMKQSLRKTR